MENCIKEYTVGSVTEFINKVEEIYKQRREYIKNGENKKKNHKHLFFRGHSDENYKLIPTILRNDKSGNKLDEKEILNDFVHYGPQHNIKYDFERERINILTDMQHNGIPTRLLDWTVAPLNALFFAVCDAECGKTPEVIVFDPWAYNGRVINYDSHPRIQDIHIHARALLSSGEPKQNWGYIKKYIQKEFRIQPFLQYPIEKPIALVSNFTNSRMLQQRGVFTIHGSDKNDMSKWQEFKENSWRIKINKCHIECIKEELNRLYINYYSIYPDFAGMKSQIEYKKGLFNI